MVQIYTPQNKDFEHNGDTVLLPLSASVHVILNGAWEATIEHPIDADGRWKYIKEDAVVKMPSFNGNQLFRIKRTEKKESGITATAEPIFLDAMDDCFLVDVRPTRKTGQEALDIMTAVNPKYTGVSDIMSANTAYYQYTNLIAALNGESENSFVSRWGGEIVYDNFKVTINQRAGADNGVELRYGKNIQQDGLTEEVDISEVTTRIYPKAYNGRTMTDNGYVDSELIDKYPTVRTRTISFEDIKIAEDASEDDAENGITICQNQKELDDALRKKCQEYYELGADKPRVTISADMAILQYTDQYKNYQSLENVTLGDTVRCYNSRLGIRTDARVIELTFDCMLKKVTSVVLGDEKRNYFDGVSSAVDRIDSVTRPDGSLVADKIAGFINGAMASLRAQYNVAEKQDVLAILFENLDPASEMFGALGIGTQGIMISKQRNADNSGWVWTTAITYAGIMANTIVTGLLSSKSGNSWLDLDTGFFNFNGNLYITDDGKARLKCDKIEMLDGDFKFEIRDNQSVLPQTVKAWERVGFGPVDPDEMANYKGQAINFLENDEIVASINYTKIPIQIGDLSEFPILTLYSKGFIAIAPDKGIVAMPEGSAEINNKLKAVCNIDNETSNDRP